MKRQLTSLHINVKTKIYGNYMQLLDFSWTSLSTCPALLCSVSHCRADGQIIWSVTTGFTVCLHAGTMVQDLQDKTTEGNRYSSSREYPLKPQIAAYIPYMFVFVYMLFTWF